MVTNDRWTSFRFRAAERLHRLSERIQPPVHEDPHAWEVSVVKVAANAGSRDAAIRSVYQVTKDLDAKTIHLVLLLLAEDIAWAPDLGSPEKAIAWAADRKFHLMIKDLGV